MAWESPRVPDAGDPVKYGGRWGDGEIDDSGIVMEVEDAWNLEGMGMLSFMSAIIGVSVCVLLLVVVGVVVLVWMWMVVTVWVVVEVLAVLLAMVVATMVGILVEVGCVGVVFELSSEDFVVVALEDFKVVLLWGWRMTLWCWNERGEFLRRFSLMPVAGNMYVAATAFLFGIVICMVIWLLWS